MDPSLLKTKNYHEVKHWIEPGLSVGSILISTSWCKRTHYLELVSFGWGQYDFNEETKLMDENKLRKREKHRDDETV